MTSVSLGNMLETTVYSKALDALARSLWIIFAGWALLLPAVCLLGVQLLADRNQWDFPGEAVLRSTWPMLALAGFLLNLYGKYKCFELRQPLLFGKPLPGAKQLSISFYADITAALIRLLAKGALRAKLGWMATPFYLAGQIMFLLFLRKMADIVHSQGIKRLIEGVLVSLILLAVFASGSVGLLLGQVRNPFALLSTGLATLVFLALTTGGYLLVLVQLAWALGSFAKYLRETSWEEESPDVLETSTLRTNEPTMNRPV